jgi:nitrite reductase/ring-hydroxylating ferredoxin subunit
LKSQSGEEVARPQNSTLFDRAAIERPMWIAAEWRDGKVLRGLPSAASPRRAGSSDMIETHLSPHQEEDRQMPEQLAGTVEELGPGSVRGIGDWAVLNVNGERYAVSRRCRHLRADLANGKIDEDGCLVCPWHQSRYDPTSGRMVVGPQAGFEKVPGLDTAFIQLTKLWPLRRAEVVERGGKVYVNG